MQSLTETIRHFKSALEAETVIRRQYEHWTKPGLFEDSKPFLNRIDLPVYLLSNIDSADIAAALNFHEIEVHGVLTSEDVRAYKPRPELFREALGRYGYRPEEVLHIGDSLTSDVLGAQGAGIKTVWLNRKGKLKPDSIKPEHVCCHLLEVLKLVSQV
nr:HAD family hydrolase [Paenibacillus humicola]